MSQQKDAQESPQDPLVDDYTARMDRMVKSLKKKSDIERDRWEKMYLIGFGVGILLVIVCVYFMLNFGSRGFEGLTQLFGS